MVSNIPIARGTHMLLLSALTSLITLALALSEFRPVNLMAKSVFSLGFSSAGASSPSAGAAAGAAGAAAAGIAMSVMFRRVCTSAAMHAPHHAP